MWMDQAKLIHANLPQFINKLNAFQSSSSSLGKRFSSKENENDTRKTLKRINFNPIYSHPT